jgi:hypothetical protein
VVWWPDSTLHLYSQWQQLCFDCNGLLTLFRFSIANLIYKNFPLSIRMTFKGLKSILDIQGINYQTGKNWGIPPFPLLANCFLNIKNQLLDPPNYPNLPNLPIVKSPWRKPFSPYLLKGVTQLIRYYYKTQHFSLIDLQKKVPHSQSFLTFVRSKILQKLWVFPKWLLWMKHQISYISNQIISTLQFSLLSW